MYLIVREVAARLRISISSVYTLIDSGQLVAHRVGARRGKILVSKTDLEACLADRRGSSTVENAGKTQRTTVANLKHVKL